MIRLEMLVISHRDINQGLWSHIGCSEQIATIYQLPKYLVERKNDNNKTSILKDQQDIKCKYMEEHKLGKILVPDGTWKVMGSNPICDSDFFPSLCLSMYLNIKTLINVHFRLVIKPMGLFRVPLCLCFETGLSAKPF